MAKPMTIDDYVNDPRRIESEFPITISDVRFLLTTLLRHPQMLRSAVSAGLKYDLFTGPGEPAYGYVFQAASALIAKNSAITEQILRTELLSWAAAGAINLPQEQIDEILGNYEIAGFLTEAFNPPEMKQPEVLAEKEYGQKLLYKFLKARLITQQLSTVINSTANNSSPEQLEEFLGQWYRRAQSIRHIGVDVDEDDFMPEFGAALNYDIVVPTPTGLPWVDTYLGGFCEGEVIGLLGPTGGGKSNMMICAAVRMAQYYAANNIPKVSVYVCYEDGNYRMRPLFWSAATHIRREIFSSADFNWATLSTSEMPNDNDRRLPENQNGEFILGERERYMAAQVWMKSHFKFFDFSYNVATGGRGVGGIPEIVSAVEQLCERRGMSLGFLAIDYAGIMIERNLAATGKLTSNDVSGIYLPLKMLGDNVRYSIAGPFNATVMVAHQIAGADAKVKPFYRYLHHWDVQGCKAFAENLHSCVCVNKEDTDTQARLIQYSKIRYGQPPTNQGIIRIKSEYCGIDLITNDYHVDEFSKKIVPNNELSSAAGERGPSRSRTQRPDNRLVPGDNFSNILR
jgi:hypothetical protein